MFLIHPLRQLGGGIILLMAAFCALAQPAGAQMKRLSFDEKVSKADQIFLATCTERESVFQNGEIVTRYKLQPIEFWKGSTKLNQSGQIEFEEIGGQIDGALPIGRQAPGMADIRVGEEVLLFTRTPVDRLAKGKPQGRKILTPGTLRIVGRDQGRFSVFRHPETGEKLVGKFAPTGLQAKVENHAKEEAAKRIAAMREKGVTAQDTGETTSSQFSRITNEEVEALKRPLGNRYDKAAQRAQTERDVEAARDPNRAEDIYTFESLESVKARVQQSLRPAS